MIALPYCHWLSFKLFPLPTPIPLFLSVYVSMQVSGGQRSILAILPQVLFTVSLTDLECLDLSKLTGHQAPRIFCQHSSGSGITCVHWCSQFIYLEWVLRLELMDIVLTYQGLHKLRHLPSPQSAFWRGCYCCEREYPPKWGAYGFFGCNARTWSTV